jgi:nitrogen fixation protein FixH
MMPQTATRPLTGRKVAMWFIAFFGVVIAVNLIMAREATATFGGVVVGNSYVASQNYNRWLDAADAQQRLGWSAEAKRLADGRVAVTFTGTGDAALLLSGEARHPLGRQPDLHLEFVSEGTGRFVSREAVPAGRWRLRLAAAVGVTKWRGEVEVR